MNDHRLPDEDLTVLVERAAEVVAANRGHEWASLHGAAKNAFREKCLPIIFHSTKALHDLGYRKPRTITTAEELDALPEGSIIRDNNGDALRSLKRIDGKNWLVQGREYIASGFIPLPAIVLWEPK